ncbi:hypothetical protein F5X98DRAFT_335714, partial [Xylaria grammica]
MASPADVLFTIGNDICRIARVRRVLTGRLGPQFVRRILTPKEIRHATTASILRCVLDQKPQWSQDAQAATDLASVHDAREITRAVEFMAGRFAAKEAVIKAHPYRRITFQTVSILRASFHAPEGSVSHAQEWIEELAMEQGEAQEGEPEDKTSTALSGPLVARIEGDADTKHATYASVSISHDTEYATAVCLGRNWSRAPRRRRSALPAGSRLI